MLEAIVHRLGAGSIMAALESKTAGQILGIIVMMLMLPMLLIGYFYYSSAQVEIRALEQEQAGLRLLQAVYPPLMSADKSITPEQIATIHQLEAQLPAALSSTLEDRWSKQMQSVMIMSSGRRDDVARNSMASYINDVASASGLALDSDKTSFFMIDAAVLTLPGMVKDVQDLGQLMRGFAANPAGFKMRLQQIAQIQGRVRAARDRFADSFARSVRESGGNANVAAIANENTVMGAELNQFDQLVAMSGGGAIGDPVPLLLQAQGSATAIKEGARKISVAAFSELDRLLQARKDAAQNKLTVLMLIGLATAAAALVLAYRMFRRTLTKLDQVEAARGTALRAQEDTQRINGEIAALNRTLASKIEELQEAQSEIVKKGRMEQLGQLTATIAHELRNPLGAVRTSAYLINRKIGGKGYGVDEQISRIEKGVIRCDSIITQLLDFSRTKKIAALPANLDSWLTNIVTEEANRLPANVQIDCILGLEDQQVAFDQARLERAVINLLSNAAEAMVAKDAAEAKPAGAYPQIWISTFNAGETVAIRVKDNGPGIDAGLITKIREPLFTTKSFGTGLGIPAIEQIAIQHGGWLDIKSSPGEGAEFTIYIPSMQPQSETPGTDVLHARVA